MRPSSELPTIPVIDISPLLGRGGATGGRDRVAEEIGKACREVGFFYIRNHGITEEELATRFATARAFFALPLEEKMELHIGRGNNFRGYVPLCGEVTGGKRDWHECLDIKPKDPRAGRVSGWNRDRHVLDDEDQWPRGLPEFRPVMLRTWDSMVDLSERLTEALAVSLGLAPGYFRPYTGESFCDLRLAHYPPYEPRAGDGVELGMGAHCDNGVVTLLPQDAVGGLEVRNVAGEWISAPHIEGTFVVNIGRMTERWSNDRYPATWHRVLLPRGRERYSMPFFYEPLYDAVIAPVPTCCDAEHPARYAPCHFGSFLDGEFSRAYGAPAGGLDAEGAEGREAAKA